MKISPTPPIESFKRLQVTDGLLITPTHWKDTQTYHRHRQNFHFQCMHQPGIVSGLGVTLTQAAEDIDAQYRDGRWLKIHPGIAIDAAGNPIVVTQPEVFQVKSAFSATQPSALIYLVINYVDPDRLRYPPDQTTVPETYRIIQKTTLSPLDVELCRIELTHQSTHLSLAADVYHPTLNTLDYRYRAPVAPRPQQGVRVAHIAADTATSTARSPIQQGYNNLLHAAQSLYPALQADGDLQSLPTASLAHQLFDAYDLIACDDQQLPTLASKAPKLKDYLSNGGVICVHAPLLDTQLAQLQTVRAELYAARTELNKNNQLETSVRQEIEATEAEIKQYIQRHCEQVFHFCKQLSYPLNATKRGAGHIATGHPLLTEPFMFYRLPQIQQQLAHVFCWGGVVLMVSSLVDTWAMSDRIAPSRNTLRTAQEWGINLLHYAARYRQLHQLQGTTSAPPPPVRARSLNTAINKIGKAN